MSKLSVKTTIIAMIALAALLLPMAMGTVVAEVPANPCTIMDRSGPVCPCQGNPVDPVQAPGHPKADEPPMPIRQADEVQGMPECRMWSVLVGPSACGGDVIARAYTTATHIGVPTRATAGVRLYRWSSVVFPSSGYWQLVDSDFDSDAFWWGGFTPMAEARFLNADCHWYRAVSHHQVVRGVLRYNRSRERIVHVCFCGWCHLPMEQPPGLQLSPSD